MAQRTENGIRWFVAGLLALITLSFIFRAGYVLFNGETAEGSSGWWGKIFSFRIWRSYLSTTVGGSSYLAYVLIFGIVLFVVARRKGD